MEGAEKIEFPNRTMYESVWENNKDNLSDTALIYYGKKITYGQLFSMINLAFEKMKALGIRKSDTVAFISILTPEMIAMFYALNKLGAIACMMDPRTAPECLAKYIKTADTKCVFVQDVCNGVADEVLRESNNIRVVVFSTSTMMGFPAKAAYAIKTKCKPLQHEHVKYNVINTGKIISQDIQEEAGDLPAVVCYTGGTTGESKGVLLSNNNANAIVEQYRIPTGGFERQQKWLSPAVPFIAYYLICSLHGPLMLGMQCFLEIYDNEKMKKIVKKNRINHLCAIPSFYEEMLKEDNSDWSYVIMPTTGGDKLSEKTYNTVNEALKKGNCDWKICNGYGMTEVSSGACMSFFDGCNKVGSVGIPLAQTIVSAFNPDTGEEAKIGEQGEICIAGPGVMIGYLNNEEATKDIIRTHHGQRWMHTGDIGHVDEDGCVFIDGRMKRMIVRFDGFKLFPTLIEEKLLTCGLIDNCSCVGMSDDGHGVGQVAVVFYTIKDDEGNLEEVENELRKTALELLPKYSQPFAYKKIDELPRTKIGKVDYRKLESLL